MLHCTGAVLQIFRIMLLDWQHFKIKTQVFSKVKFHFRETFFILHYFTHFFVISKLTYRI